MKSVEIYAHLLSINKTPALRLDYEGCWSWVGHKEREQYNHDKAGCWCMDVSKPIGVEWGLNHPLTDLLMR